MGVKWRLVDWDGKTQRRAKDFTERMERVAPSIRKRINAANEKSSEELVAMMRRLVPVDERELQFSITYYEGVRAILKGVVWYVSAGDEVAYYARWVEFGNGITPAQPFFYPSYRALRRLIRNRQLRAFRQGLKDADTG